MIFSSLAFIVFFSCLILIMLAMNLHFITARIPDIKMRGIRQMILLLASYFFYAWWDWRFCFLMFAITLVSYISAIRIEQNGSKFFKVLGIVFPLCVLAIFKYANFFLDSFMSLLNIDHPGTLSIILPVGISFYVFQSMSYVIDIMRGKISSTGFLKYALYISFFPQLVAGPIIRASSFLPQLEEDRKINIKNFEVGIQIFVFGMFKKVVLADNLSVFVDDVFRMPAAFHSATVCLAVIAYSMQIYLDFSGYSDMAIGCAKCLGYDFARNFNLPYISKNISEFWKRWHISLSSWLKDYLYISLGGNRKGTYRTLINLMITMLLGGLWHGASWTFVFWGALHGLALCVHKGFRSCFHVNKGSWIGDGISILGTYVFVCLCWVFFRADSFTSAMVIIKKLFIWSPGIIQPFSWAFISIVIIACATIFAIAKNRRTITDEGMQESVNGVYPILDLSKIWSLTLFFCMVGLTIGLAYVGSNPFIYFQF